MSTKAELLADLIYNSVTTLIVGEKVMIEMPTFWFPSGAARECSRLLQPSPTHGDTRSRRPLSASPSRFSSSHSRTSEWKCYSHKGCRDREHSRSAQAGGCVKGPMRIWVVLDGYLTRDVQ